MLPPRYSAQRYYYLWKCLPSSAALVEYTTTTTLCDHNGTNMILLHRLVLQHVFDTIAYLPFVLVEHAISL